MSDTGPIDLERLFKLRAAVARFGEIDAAGWWNTTGVLGPRGPAVYSRGLPKTHFFAQVRIAVTVAGWRSAEIFDPPQSITLWRLSPHTEQALELAVGSWLDQAQEWMPFFESIQLCDGGDLLEWLKSLGLADDELATEAQALRRSAEGRAVPLPGGPQEDDHTVALLAAGFSRGEKGALAVPYARVGS